MSDEETTEKQLEIIELIKCLMKQYKITARMLSYTYPFETNIKQ